METTFSKLKLPGNTKKRYMAKFEHEALINTVKGLDHTELEIMIEHIPIEYCFNRVAKYLEECRTAEGTRK